MFALVLAFLLAGVQRFLVPRVFQDAAALFLFTALPILAIMALLRGLKWKKQGGPAARLARRAFGAAAGWLVLTLLTVVGAFFLRR
jgi:hypothetical protein